MPQTPLRRDRDRNERVLRPIRPNVGIEASYAAKLSALVEEMATSLEYWLRAAYRKSEPEAALIAQDELSTTAMRAALRKLADRFSQRFDEAAPKLGEWFAQAVGQRSQTALRKVLRDGGFTVDFTMTPAMRDIMKATIEQQVSLIKSIPAQLLTQVEGAVMRSVAVGRDLGALSKELREHFGVSKRRAAFIARSQNGIATASMTRARQVEVGITEAIWMHSGGGREPRRSHLKAGREQTRYDVSKGWFDPEVQKWIWPGELPNCRCVAKAVVRGFS